MHCVMAEQIEAIIQETLESKNDFKYDEQIMMKMKLNN